MKQIITVTIYGKMNDRPYKTDNFMFSDLQKAVNFQQTSLAIEGVTGVELIFGIEKEAENERDH